MKSSLQEMTSFSMKQTIALFYVSLLNPEDVKNYFNKDCPKTDSSVGTVEAFLACSGIDQVSKKF